MAIDQRIEPFLADEYHSNTIKRVKLKEKRDGLLARVHYVLSPPYGEFEFFSEALDRTTIPNTFQLLTRNKLERRFHHYGTGSDGEYLLCARTGLFLKREEIIVQGSRLSDDLGLFPLLLDIVTKYLAQQEQREAA